MEKTKRQDGNHVEKTYGCTDTKGQGSHDSNVCKISRIGESMETEGRAMVAMGWEKKVDGECLPDGHRVFLWGGETISELDRGDNCTTLRMHQMPL